LLKVPTLINLAMFVDRKGSAEDVLRRLKKVLAIGKRLTPEEQLQLKDWILDVVLKKAKRKLDKSATDNVRRAFETEEEKDMTYAIERAFDEVERRGRREGKLEAAEAMLKDGVPLETVSRYSGIPVEELKRHIENGILQ
jgi:predicted transposase/invertase (TIGR01784 family)